MPEMRMSLYGAGAVLLMVGVLAGGSSPGTGGTRGFGIAVGKSHSNRSIYYVGFGEHDSYTVGRSISVVARERASSERAGTGASTSTSSDQAGIYVPLYDRVSRGNSGCLLVSYKEILRPDALSEHELAGYVADLRLANSTEFCQGSKYRSAGQLATSWWAFFGMRNMPVPTPKISPGWGMPGQPVFLSVGAPLRFRFSVDTPIGTLAFLVSGLAYVNWGDGTISGPFNVPGGPWPAGQIQHVWDSSGLYVVRVTVDWSAQWSLDGEYGSVSGLQTSGDVANFPVDQVVGLNWINFH
jgi:hypothetical protein